MTGQEDNKAVSTEAGSPGRSGWARDHWDILALAAVLGVALALRLMSYNHVLSFDEAWNAVTLSSAVTSKTGGYFFFNFYRHPPLFMGISYVITISGGQSGATAAGARKALADSAMSMRMVSVASGLGVIACLFFMLRKQVNRYAALFSAFFLAVMPVAVVFDTWLKQDSLAILFGALFVYAFLDKRYYLAGASLGLGLLTKEIVIFIALSVFLYTLLTYSRKKLLGVAKAFLVAFLMSFWWFVIFSNSTGDFIKFFLGTSPVNELAMFQQPFTYYVTRFPVDFTWPVSLLALAGVSFWIVERYKSKRRLEQVERGGEDPVLLFTLWSVVVLVIMTASRGKPVWMIYSAAFGVAAMAGYGLWKLASLPVLRKGVALTLVALFIAGGLALGFTLSHDEYMEASGSWGNAVEDYEIAMALNDCIGSGQVLLMPEEDMSPNLAYYLDIFVPETIEELPLYDEFGELLQGAPPCGTEGKKIYLISEIFPLELVLSYVNSLEADIVMAKLRYDEETGEWWGLAADLEDLASPLADVGRARIFMGGELPDDSEDRIEWRGEGVDFEHKFE